MKAMNGCFDFTSTPKQGTTATLTLPIGPRMTTIMSACEAWGGEIKKKEEDLCFATAAKDC
jgi:hypothetical protein